MKRIFGRSDWFWAVLLSVVVLLPNVYLAAVGVDLQGNLLAKIAFLLMSMVVFCFPALLFKAKVFFLLQGVFVLLAPVEIAHIYLNKTSVTTGFMMAVFDTDYHETMELLASLLPFVLCVICVWVLYFFITIRKIENSYFVPKMKFRAGFLACLALAFFLLFAYQYRMALRITAKSEQNVVLESACSGFCSKFQKIYPCSIVLKSKAVLVVKNEIRRGQTDLQNFVFDARKKEQIKGKEIYVFVIGETGRYSSYSVNGYARSTSPLLEKIDGLVSFSDFYSEANLTSMSLPFILTRATALEYDRYLHEKSFVDAFKEAGFKTYWIANQSAGNSFIKRISKDADGEYFTTKDFDQTDNFDQNLWVYLDKVLEKNDEKVLIVLHTLGSHYRYNYRYPAEYEVFKPSFRGAFNYNMTVPENKELFINTYDNSILYTDYFLANTIKKIEKQNAVSFFMYVADHGENLFDTADNIVLHGGVHPTNFDVHVPFFVWSSDKYKENYGQKWANTMNNKDKKLDASVLFYSILDAADIDFSAQNKERSIVSDLLKEDTVRYVLTSDYTVKVFK
ncbi:MAG: phosphoethanolamine transferase [Prevotellaceae bacterium]|jgi:glucan phosphoethanolaminetransferase (alkaline phosphatase superfamily)|nr:phosphoethanolamine transferase [Prevotellaceae bacterium]